MALFFESVFSHDESVSDVPVLFCEIEWMRSFAARRGMWYRLTNCHWSLRSVVSCPLGRDSPVLWKFKFLVALGHWVSLGYVVFVTSLWCCLRDIFSDSICDIAC